MRAQLITVIGKLEQSMVGDIQALGIELNSFLSMDDFLNHSAEFNIESQPIILALPSSSQSDFTKFNGAIQAQQEHQDSIFPVIVITPEYFSQLASVCGFEQGYVDCLVGRFHSQQLIMKLRNANTLVALHHQNKPDWFRDPASLSVAFSDLLLKTSTVNDLFLGCLGMTLEITGCDVAAIFDFTDDLSQFRVLASSEELTYDHVAAPESPTYSYFVSNFIANDGTEVGLPFQQLLGTKKFAACFDKMEGLGVVIGSNAQAIDHSFGAHRHQAYLKSSLSIIAAMLKHRNLLSSNLVIARLFSVLTNDCDKNISLIEKAQSAINSSLNLEQVTNVHDTQKAFGDLHQQLDIPHLPHLPPRSVNETIAKALSLEHARHATLSQLAASNRMLSTTWDISRLITQHSDIDQLLQSTCTAFIESDVFKHTEIQRTDSASRVYSACRHPSLLETEEHSSMFSFEDLEQLKKEKVLLCPHASSNVEYVHAIIQHQGIIYGVFSGLSDYIASDNHYLKELLQEIGEDLGFAMYNLIREQAHRAQNIELNLILEAANIGTWTFDMETNTGYSSAKIGEYLGYSGIRNRFTGDKWKSNVHPEDIEHVMSCVNEHIDEYTEGYEVEYRFRNSQGEWLWVLDRGQVLERDSFGRPLVICGTQGDIHERKLAEQEQEELERKLAQAQQLESIGRLAGGVAHDFNNLLSVISGFSELLLFDHMDNEDTREKLETIKQACDRAKNLTTQLLMFSKKQSPQYKIVEWNQMISGSLNVYRRLIEENIDLTFEIGETLPTMKADPQQLDQILANLLVNARDAVRQVKNKEHKPRIHITTYSMFFPAHTVGNNQANNHYVCLEVSDNGIGMTNEVRSHIFEPFYSTKGLSKGTGLGLATVLGIVEQNKGLIEVDSEVNIGTTFTVYWPVTDEVIEEHTASQAITDLYGDFQHILVVEDQRDIRRYCQDVLQRYRYQVTVASCAEQAMQYLVDGLRPDLLITDVVLPEKSGKQLADEMQSLWPDIPVLYCSGYTDDILAPHGVIEPSIKLLTKPFTSKDLLQTVKEKLTSSVLPVESKLPKSTEH